MCLLICLDIKHRDTELVTLIFYSILLRHVVNVPIADDYYALLNFLNHMREAPNLSAKAHYFLISQYNQYKLFFEHALFWLQLEFSGHLDLAILCILGDSFVLWLAILLWKMFLPREHRIQQAPDVFRSNSLAAVSTAIRANAQFFYGSAPRSSRVVIFARSDLPFAPKDAIDLFMVAGVSGTRSIVFRQWPVDDPDWRSDHCVQP
jgi:hypothetical protein